MVYLSLVQLMGFQKSLIISSKKGEKDDTTCFHAYPLNKSTH